MKNILYYIVGTLLLFVVGATSVSAANNDIAIAEVLFDPAGTDTGLEYIVLKNFGTDVVNISGWDLYPDGIGYFTVPDFSLNAGAEATIHLRTSGTNDATNLYFSSASSNMGNSSGSLALFSSKTDHSKSTIVSFMRYHKASSTERKTWESTAASAGLWTAGAYIDIATATEGDVFTLNSVAQKTSPSGWGIKQTSTENQNQENASTTQTIDTTTNDTGLPHDAYGPPPLSQKIIAYAGKDVVVLAGAQIPFTGYAEDMKGEPLDAARFLWNFGDGAVGEGKSVAHSYRYPGIYSVMMDVSSGIYDTSDNAKATVIESPLVISEIKPGTLGWIEIVNNSARLIDVSGFGVQIANNKPFYFPPRTNLAPWAAIVLDEDTTKGSIAVSGRVAILYPNGKILLETAYDAGALHDGESLNLVDDEWTLGVASPGVKNLAKRSVAKNTSNIVVASKSEKKQNTTTTPHARTSTIDQPVNQTDLLSASVADSAPASFSWKSSLWLLGGIAAGIIGGGAFLAIKMIM